MVAVKKASRLKTDCQKNNFHNLRRNVFFTDIFSDIFEIHFLSVHEILRVQSTHYLLLDSMSNPDLTKIKSGITSLRQIQVKND